MITILEDKDSSMIKIIKDNETIFTGNYWDLKRDGESLSKLFMQLGLTVNLKEFKYD